jgi:hypothetical protein
MQTKELKYINQAYDKLYDVVSRVGLFKEQLEFIEEYMKTQGYKVQINGWDKCVFIKAEKSASFSNMNKRQWEKFNKQMENYRRGIIEDLKMGRDISAIICGYGFIYREEYDNAFKWIQENIQIEMKGGDK